MNRLFMFIALICTFSTLSAQPIWKWARATGGTRQDQAYAVSVDNIGNVYTTGFFNSDSIVVDGTSYYNSSTYGSTFFIAKYDSIGNALWVRTTTGQSQVDGHEIGTDNAGNVYVCGGFLQSPNFNGISLTGSLVWYEIFLVKYNSNGTVQWAIPIGGTADDYIMDMQVDGAGNSYLVGTTTSSVVNFGSSSYQLSQIGTHENMFIAKIDPSGVLIWAHAIEDAKVKSVDVDVSGNVYCVGDFSANTLNFSGTVINNVNSSTTNITNAFIAKYNSNGSLLWAKAAGNKNGSYSYTSTFDICADDNGNSYICGGTSGPDAFYFDNIVLNPIYGDYYDGFIAKYDQNGNAVWAVSEGGSSTDRIRAIDMDGTGNIYTVVEGYGEFANSSINIGLGIIKRSSSNQLIYAKPISYPVSTTNLGDLWIHDFKVDNIGSAYLTGSHSDTFYFDVDTINVFGGVGDIYVARLGHETSGLNVLKDGLMDDLCIYPNPTTGRIMVTGASAEATICITDMLGREVYVGQLNSSEVNLDYLLPGSYVLQMTDNTGNRIVRNIVKQ
jgi:hypothetical protein